MKLASALLACCLFATPALANEVSLASTRDMMLEFKISPFTPMIDVGYTSGQGPYQHVFGGGPMLLGEIEYEYQFFQKFGTLSAGVSAGYAEKFAKAFIANTDIRSADTTGLRLVPIKALVSYRFDYFWVHGNVPLVPYAKFALVGMPWFAVKGSEIETADGLRGAGFKVGIAGTIGVSFCLDVLDRRMARDFDSSTGVNHTYLFGEFTGQDLQLYEAPGSLPLNLLSAHWAFGLAFEF
jgi:hypothetical protein